VNKSKEEILFPSDIDVDCPNITLPESHERLWVTVRNISVCIIRTDEGVVVDMFEKNAEDGDHIATTYAFFDTDM